MVKEESENKTVYRCSICGEIVGYISERCTSVGLCEHLSGSLHNSFEESEE